MKLYRIFVADMRFIRKVITYICFLPLVLLACENKNKQDTQNKGDIEEAMDSTAMAKIEFQEKSFNFGDMMQGEIVTHTFRFKNTGDKNLIIKRIESSCGCTAAKYDKKPIPPGEESDIEVEFNSEGRFGKQLKVITIFANIPQQTTELNIIANIKNQ